MKEPRSISPFPMHTIIHPLKSASSRNRQPGIVDDHKFLRSPHYECVEHNQLIEITAFVPGVDAAGIEIVACGPDLTITAKKSRFVRVNFQSLHLESAQRDYRLVLRLGNGLDFESISAEIREGVLTVRIPKKEKRSFAGSHLPLSRVA